MAAPGQSASCSEFCISSSRNTPLNTKNHRNNGTSETEADAETKTFVPLVKSPTKETVCLKTYSGIPETYIEVLIVEPSEKLPQMSVERLEGSSLTLETCKTITTSEACASSRDVLPQNLTDISDKHDSGVATSAVFSEIREASCMLPVCHNASAGHQAEPLPSASDLKAQSQSQTDSGSPTDQIFKSIHNDIGGSDNGNILLTPNSTSQQSSIDAGVTTHTSSQSKYCAQAQRQPWTTTSDAPSRLFAGISPLATSTPVLQQSNQSRKYSRSSGNQTTDSGICLSGPETPSTPCNEEVHPDSATTCSSWATSEDSNQRLLELDHNDDNSKDGENALDTSLSSMHWLGNYGNRSKYTPQQQQAIAQGQLSLTNNSTLNAHHWAKLKFYNPREVHEMHREYGVMQRPPYSYMNLIQMALSTKRPMAMKLKEICRWIEDHFPFYKLYAKPGWRNSIRHNLSLYPCFAKDEKSKKIGGYWTLRFDRLEPATDPVSRSVQDSWHIKVNGCPTVAVAGGRPPSALSTITQSPAAANLSQSSLLQSGNKKSGLPVLLPRPAPTQAFVLVPVDQVSAPALQSARQTPMVFIPKTAGSASTTPTPKLPLPPKLVPTPVAKLPLPPQTKPAPTSNNLSALDKQKTSVPKLGQQRKHVKIAGSKQRGRNLQNGKALKESQNLVEQAWRQANTQSAEPECETLTISVSLLNSSASQGGFQAAEFSVSEKERACKISAHDRLHCSTAYSCGPGAACCAHKRQVNEDGEKNVGTDLGRSSSLPPILAKRIKSGSSEVSQQSVSVEQTKAPKEDELHNQAKTRSRRKQVYPQQNLQVGMSLNSAEAEITIICTPAASASTPRNQPHPQSEHFSVPLTINQGLHSSHGHQQSGPILCQEQATSDGKENVAQVQTFAPHTSTPLRKSRLTPEQLPSPIQGFTSQHLSPCHLNNSFLENLDSIFVSPPSCSQETGVLKRVSPSTRVLYHHGRFMASLTQQESSTFSNLPELTTPPSISLRDIEAQRRSPRLSIGEMKKASNSSRETTSRKSLEFALGDDDVQLLDEVDIPSFNFSGCFNSSPPYEMQASCAGHTQQTDGDHNLMHFIFDSPQSLAAGQKQHPSADMRSQSDSLSVPPCGESVAQTSSGLGSSQPQTHYAACDAESQRIEAGDQVYTDSQYKRALDDDLHCDRQFVSVPFTHPKENTQHYKQCYTPADTQKASSDVSRMLFPQPEFLPGLHFDKENSTPVFNSWQSPQSQTSSRWDQQKLNPDQCQPLVAIEPNVEPHAQTTQNDLRNSSKLPNFLDSPGQEPVMAQEQYSVQEPVMSQEQYSVSLSGSPFHSHLLAHRQPEDTSAVDLFDSLFQS